MKVPHDPKELLDIVDSNDKVIGQHLRKKYVDGKLHRQVSLFLFNNKGELLVQVREDNGKLDPSVSGHVSHNSTYLESMIRETHEEIGLKIPKKEFKEIGKIRITTKKLGLVRNDRFMKLYVVKANYSITKMTIDPGEVKTVMYLTIDELQKLIKQNKKKTTESLRKCLELYLNPTSF